MKKYLIAGSVWLCLLMSAITITSKAEIAYEIQYDSHTKQTYEQKEEIQNVYTKLVTGVHKESYMVMVLHNLEAFETKDNIRAEWKHNRLLITEGDGKGARIKGDLVANSICIPEVQPRSFLEELFQ